MHTRTIDWSVEASTHTQWPINNAWSDMATSILQLTTQLWLFIIEVE